MSIIVRKMFRKSANGLVEVSVDPNTFNKLVGGNGVKKLPFTTHPDVGAGGGFYDFLVDGYQVLVKRIETDKIDSNGKNIWRTQPIMKIADALKLYVPLVETPIDAGVWA